MNFEAVIGLEVHAQIATETKIFCSCSTNFGAEPNTNVCPVCLGMPGVLPVLNKKALEFAMKAGVALNCSIQEKSVFARKNYFYPDLPKGYQISQYDLPLCLDGKLSIETSDINKDIGITRIHMEEDAGKSIHGENLGDASSSYVDLNRTGVPLIEIVSEPDIRSGEEAKMYLQKLKAVLQYAGVSECNMEEGSLRCDANISIRPEGQTEFGTKAEIKNMNSFKNVQKAIEYEIKRQEKMLSEGENVIQETRLWSPDKGITVSMRSKEEAHDYRYFPDPDLIPVIVDNNWVSKVKSSLTELPDEKKQRFKSSYKLPEYDAEVLTSIKDYADFFEKSVAAYNNPKIISNWIMSEVLRVVNEKNCSIFEINIAPEYVGELVRLIDEGTISGKIAKDVFEIMLDTGDAPEKIIKDRNMAQISDTSELEDVIMKIFRDNPDELERFKSGEKKLQGFFVGQVMKQTKGQANPKLVNELLGKLSR